MHTDGNNSHGVRHAFTLIELLVVIAIIAILAGMILAGVMTVKSRAMVSRAKVEVSSIAAAINDYTAAYGMPPVSAKVWDCSKNNFKDSVNYPDFTYGFASGTTTIKSYGNPNYVANNAEIIAVLRNAAATNSTLTGTTMRMNDLVAALNSKKVMYLDAPLANNSILPGVGTDGVFRDPWGNPYIISLDLDMNGGVLDGFYGDLIERKVQSQYPNYPSTITGSVMVWSLGPDGRANVNPAVPAEIMAQGREAILKFGDNKDNVVSWDK